jgi:hypothetical protein
MSALPPITDVGQHIQVSIWLSVYEYTPLGLAGQPRPLPLLHNPPQLARFVIGGLSRAACGYRKKKPRTRRGFIITQGSVRPIHQTEQESL